VHVGQDTPNQILELCTNWSGLVTNILLDTRDPKAKGGTGKSFNWEIAKQFRETTGVPFFLAGGLDSDNVFTAVKQVMPYAVDVSSGVETNGTKDLNKIRAFIVNAKSSQLQNKMF